MVVSGNQAGKGIQHQQTQEHAPGAFDAHDHQWRRLRLGGDELLFEHELERLHEARSGDEQNARESVSPTFAPCLPRTPCTPRLPTLAPSTRRGDPRITDDGDRQSDEEDAYPDVVGKVLTEEDLSRYPRPCPLHIDPHR